MRIITCEMPSRCKICTHPDRATIDSLIVSRVPASEIIKQYRTPIYSFSDAAVFRHKKHIDARLAESIARHRNDEEQLFSDTLVGQLKELQATTLLLLKSAVETDDRRNCASFIRLAQENIERQSKVANLIPTTTNINLNFYASPEWGIFWNVINRHPDVRAELDEELGRLPSLKFPVPAGLLNSP